MRNYENSKYIITTDAPSTVESDLKPNLVGMQLSENKRLLFGVEDTGYVTIEHRLTNLCMVLQMTITDVRVE